MLPMEQKAFDLRPATAENATTNNTEFGIRWSVSSRNKRMAGCKHHNHNHK